MCGSASCSCSDAAAHIRVNNSMCWPVHFTFVLENERWLDRSTLALPIAAQKAVSTTTNRTHTFSLCHLLIRSIHEIALVERETCIFSQKRRNETPKYLVCVASRKKNERPEENKKCAAGMIWFLKWRENLDCHMLVPSLNIWREKQSMDSNRTNRTDRMDLHIYCFTFSVL